MRCEGSEIVIYARYFDLDGAWASLGPRSKRAGKTVRSLHRGEAPPGIGNFKGEAVQLFEVEGRELFEALGADVAEAQPDDTMILRVSGASHQSGCISSIDQADRAVMAQQ